MKRTILTIFLLIFVCLNSQSVRAGLYSFEPVTGNSEYRYSMASQLSLELTPASAGQVLFTFYNDGPSGSNYDVDSPLTGSIAQVYFDNDGASLSFDSFEPSAGVSFNLGATPGNLPGGNNINPVFDASFSAGADNPAPDNGVNSGEYLGMLFNGDLSEVISAIDTESLRIGMHVTGINGGTSDSYVLNIISNPVPGGFLLGFIGLIIAGVKLRKYA